MMVIAMTMMVYKSDASIEQDYFARTRPADNNTGLMIKVITDQCFEV